VAVLTILTPPVLSTREINFAKVRVLNQAIPPGFCRFLPSLAPPVFDAGEVPSCADLAPPLFAIVVLALELGLTIP